MKITVVGAGNAGCLSALHLGWFTRKFDNVEIELVYNPSIPAEPVGQATILDPPRLLYSATPWNWYNNKIHATVKTGVLYEGWGKTNDEVFHQFPADRVAIHYCPTTMQEWVVKSEFFTTKEQGVEDIESIDSDYIIDCRGKPNDLSGYGQLLNPINACITGEPRWNTDHPWTRSVATRDGWAFVIPAKKEAPAFKNSIGYLYNNSITTTEEAEINFKDQFDVNVSRFLTFNNYIAKEPVIDDRIFLNGNRLFFLEPLEATALQTYLYMVRLITDAIIYKDVNDHSKPIKTMKEVKDDIISFIKKSEKFILWHYQYGSKYDTIFWKYAKSLPFKKDDEFNSFLDYSNDSSWYDLKPIEYDGDPAASETYGIWNPYSFKNWYSGMHYKYE